MRVRRRAVLMAIVCALVGAEAAVAAGDGPGEPDLDLTEASVTVAPKPAVGVVTGGDINCGGTNDACSMDMSYPTVPRSVTLSASGGPANHSPKWTGCDNVSAGQCLVRAEGHETVSLAWDAPPSVSFASPPARANGSTTFTANATDAETSVVQVAFHLPGLVETDSTAPYQFRPSSSGYFEHGQTYTLEARARDTAGNVSSAFHTFTFDSSAAFDSFSTSPALARCATPYDSCDRPLVGAVPAFSFAGPSDRVSVVCVTEKKGSQVVSDEEEDALLNPGCESAHTPAIPADRSGHPSYDGAWQTLVFVNDGLNSEEYVYEYTLDRRPPTINAPSDGAVVKAPFSVTASDRYTAAAEIALSCILDSQPVPCQNIDPADGAHDLSVTARDSVGNERVETRSFKYDTTPPEATITSGPDEGALIRTNAVTFVFTATDATAITRTCKVDQGDFGPCTGADRHSISGLAPGIHSFTLRVVDEAGRETVVTRQFVTDDPFPTNDRDPGDDQDPSPGPGPGPSTGPSPGPGAPGNEGQSGPLPLAAGRASRKFTVRRGRTRIRRLVLSGLERGAVVEVSCKGRGCFRGTTRFTARRAKLSLTSLFKRRKLRAKALVDIRVIQANRTTRVFRLRMQKGRRKPKLQALCLPSGASQPQRCG